MAALAHATFSRLVEASASSWEPLAEALGRGLDHREAMVWSADVAVAAATGELGWDGAFPRAEGDFFFGGQFSYAAKNGRSLRRTYDHHVVLAPDGSARVTTTLTIANTEEAGPLNPQYQAYLTLYGPRGAVLAEGADPPAATEQAVEGHPAAGWFRSAEPGGQTSVTVRAPCDRPAEACQRHLAAP